jgi:predicted flap endonuclease-1-like 5' DNA nuclease
MDYRLAYLSQGCVGGGPEQGVPLARAVLRRQSGTGGCCVTYIDTVSPYRRVLAQDQWPAPPGMFNLGRLVWERMETACAEIRDLGLQVAGKWHEPIAQSPHELQAFLDQEWPKNTLRSDLVEPRAGLFLDLSCRRPETPCYEVVVHGVQLETGAGSFGVRAVSFSLNKVRCKSENGRGEESQIDPLTAIRGIGREHAFKLRQRGVRTFARLAEVEFAFLQDVFPDVPAEFFEEWKAEARKFIGKSLLTEVHGIGSAYAERLHQAGIDNFRQLAAAKLASLQKLFPRVDKEQIEEWQEQARDFGGIESLTDVASIDWEQAIHLNRNGIRIIAQLGDADVEHLHKLFPRVTQEELAAWSEQARQLKH